MNKSMPRRLVRFSVFEADLDSGELFKKGQKVKLQGQPFDLLVELLKNPGNVVTRDQLKERLWPGATAGDFDSSLNRAINRVRDVLGDSAETPNFIETLPRRGYRFIGTVAGTGGVESTPDTFGAERAQLPKAKSRWRWAAGIAIAAVIALFLMWQASRRTQPQELKLRQLTTNSPENPITKAVISPDGKYLAYGDSAGIRLREISNGQTHAIPKPKALSGDDVWFPAAWFPDSARMIASSVRATSNGEPITSWSVPVLGNPVLLRDDVFAPSVSPDGSLIAFTRGLPYDTGWDSVDNPLTEELWVMGPNGEDARRLISGVGKMQFRSVQWSPDGRRLAYTAIHHGGKALNSSSLETLAVKGDPTPVVLPLDAVWEFCWLPDGRVIYVQQEAPPSRWDTNLWELKVDLKTGQPRGRARRLTNLPGFRIKNLAVSSDGRRISFQKDRDLHDVYIGRLKQGEQLPPLRRLTADDSSNQPHAWTQDGKAVIFISDRTGVSAIYRQDIDQDLAELIPTGSDIVWLPRVTPDGSSILYFAQQDMESQAIRMMRVPISGGAREPIMQFPLGPLNFDCSRRKDAPCVIEQSNAEHTLATFSAFDPASGKRRELFKKKRGPKDYPQWMIAPDGNHIGELVGDTIDILSLTGLVEKTLHVKGKPYSISWTADSKALLTPQGGPRGTVLLEIGLDGKTRPLWETRNALMPWALASPDGLNLAISRQSVSSNAWLLENF